MEYVVGTDGNEGYWMTGIFITRCWACRHFGEKDRPGHVDFCALHNHLTSKDKFCAWGEE